MVAEESYVIILRSNCQMCTGASGVPDPFKETLVENKTQVFVQNET